MTTISCSYEKEYKYFINSLKNTHPNNTNSDILNALWYAKKNQWFKSHDIIKNIDSYFGYWIHAYLHRVEGDILNSHYWYNKAKIIPIKISFDTEWEMIVGHILESELK